MDAQRSIDESLWRKGMMPPWLRRELDPVMRQMELPPWIEGGDPERWKRVFGGYYEVSSYGRVRRAKPGIGTFVGRPVRPVCGGTGYAQVSLHGNGKSERVYLHRLVAEAFIGSCPEGCVVNHKDANKTNNRLSNLEYATHKQNTAHALRVVGRRKGPTKTRIRKGRPSGDRHWSKRKPEKIARGERAGSAKLKDAQVSEIKDRLRSGERQSAIAREFGVSVAQMSRIAHGTRWGHIK